MAESCDFHVLSMQVPSMQVLSMLYRLCLVSYFLPSMRLWYSSFVPLFCLVFLDQEDKSQPVIMLTFL